MSLPSQVETLIKVGAPGGIIKDALEDAGVECSYVYLVEGRHGRLEAMQSYPIRFFNTWIVTAFLDEKSAYAFRDKLNEWCVNNGVAPINLKAKTLQTQINVPQELVSGHVNISSSAFGPLVESGQIVNIHVLSGGAPLHIWTQTPEYHRGSIVNSAMNHLKCPHDPEFKAVLDGTVYDVISVKLKG